MIKSVDVKQRIKQSDFKAEVTLSHTFIYSKACNICNKLSSKNIKDSFYPSYIT
jgi:hypothetical protein